MKKLLSFLICLLLFFSISAAEAPDLSTMSFDELVQLREQLNLAIWNSQEWQEVTVPAGVYQVGVDIPAGHWTVSVKSESYFFNVYYFDMLDEAGLGPDYSGYLFMQQIASADLVEYDATCPMSVDINMQDGWYLRVDGYALFTPYAGKPDLGFR